MLKKRSLLFLLIIAFTGCFFACSSDDDDYKNDIVGVWQLTELTENGQKQPLNSKPEFLHFVKDKRLFTYQITDENEVIKVNDGWNIKDDILTIAGDLPACYHIERLNGSTLELRMEEFNMDGNLDETYFTYRKVSESQLPVIEDEE